MGNRNLTASELVKANEAIQKVRDLIAEQANGDNDLLWAIRRKIAKELSYDERTKPSQRKRLKKIKIKSQNGKCAKCNKKLPEKYNVLDRHDGMKGYTVENTQVLCQRCDRDKQEAKGFKA